MHRSASTTNTARADRIKVAVRCRPVSPNEDQQVCVEMQDNVCSVSNGNRFDQESDFIYDFCFPMDTTQESFFEALGLHILQNALDGYHATLFAYGQTGAGKSYSVHGTSENPGLLPRLCDALFYEIERRPTHMKHLVKASYLEIYNERLRDLLTVEEAKKLEISSNPATGSAQILGLSVFEVMSAHDVHKMMKFGNDQRVQASTSMNSVSSRSHAIFTLEFLQTDTSTGRTERSKIHMVDLAGSERQNKAQVAGERLREGCVINQSLSYLGLVITGLTKGDSFVPFRNSKLTHFLIDGLSGNSKTAMIAAISPSRSNYEETVSTLRFAATCKLVKTRAIVNTYVNDTGSQLRLEVEALKKQLEVANVELRTMRAPTSDDGPMLVRPNFVFRISSTAPSTVGSDARSSLHLPSHCAACVCSLEVLENEVRCTTEEKIRRNGQEVPESETFSLDDNDLLEFAPGVAYRFQRGLTKTSDTADRVLADITPPLSAQQNAIARDVFESIHYSSDVDNLGLQSLRQLVKDDAEIVLVQSVLQPQRPILAVRQGFGLWTEEIFRELVEDDDQLTAAFRKGDLRAVKTILKDETRIAAQAELSEQVATYKDRIRTLEALREEDTRTIDKLSNEFIELSRESAQEREEWKKTQEDLLSTSDAHADESRHHRSRAGELEVTVRERDEAIRRYEKTIAELTQKYEEKKEEPPSAEAETEAEEQAVTEDDRKKREVEAVAQKLRDVQANGKPPPKEAWGQAPRAEGSDAEKDDGSCRSSSSSTAKADTRGFGPRVGAQSGGKSDTLLRQDLDALSDADPGFVEALAGLMIQQIDEGSTNGLGQIIERIDSVAQSRNASNVDSLDALLPLMAKGMRKFSQSGSVVRASFHCLARMCVRSAHNKWWLIEQALILSTFFAALCGTRSQVYLGRHVSSLVLSCWTAHRMET